ncbi:PKD domain-containing protein [Mesoterricola silvestris]|uniref:PKD domain-containing protein n=1 Tax=Mesoterricola silvestris TaxID=2927979 RepID=A0AA48GIY9_9BACT|nr:PKD domain-containing protein [Mesoterricola silvestris]BDU73841.1 hypothetical protein METEAL_30150 [Mesoterricola silvestris]
MRFTLRNSGIILSALSLALLCACGGGGGNSPNNKVAVNAPPAATAPVVNANTNSLVEYKIYTFTTTTTDPDLGDTVASCAWNFGDGSPIQTVTTAPFTVQHAFRVASAALAVTVTPTDSHGLAGTAASTTFAVAQASNPFTVTQVAPAAATLLSTQVGSTVAYTFDFMIDLDPASGLTYNAAGITFKSNDTLAGGSIGPVTAKPGTTNEWTVAVSFPAAAATDSRTFQPTLSVVDTSGALLSDLSTFPAMTVNTTLSAANPPVISVAAAPTIPVPGAANSTWQNVPITFTATATDPQSLPLTYSWSFGEAGGVGDVASTTALTQTHTYAAAGIYTMTFTATNGIPGGTKSISLVISILANAPPVLAYTQNPAGDPYAYQPITFTAGVTDPNLDASTITWDFGDGTPKVTGTTVTHTWTAMGVSNAYVTADDTKGGVVKVDIPVKVLANLPPVSQITTPAATGLLQNKSYAFTATATDPDATDTIKQFVWDFGDGVAVTSAPDASPTGVTRTTTVNHTFPTSVTGTIPVRVQAIDANGGVGDFSPSVAFQVVTTPLPVVVFTAPGATTLNVDLNGTVTQAFTFTVTNPRAGAGGATDPIPANLITFLPNDSAATVVSVVSNGGGAYTATVQYTGAAATGTRTTTPTAYATDSLGIVGVAAGGPAMTIKTLGANHTPAFTITTPAAPTTSALTSKAVKLVFTVSDQDDDPVTYTVNWGGPDTPCQPQVVTGTTTTSTLAGSTVTLTHVYPDSYAGTATVTVNGTDNRSSNATATQVSFTVAVTLNALPTAAITSPQASGTQPPAPLTILDGGQGVPVVPRPANSTDSYIVYIPAGGKLHFKGTGVLPTSGGTLTYAWTFPGGVPNASASADPGEVSFPGEAGKTIAYRVNLTVTDDTDAQNSSCVKSGRASLVVPKTTQMWVVVDGINTQQFTLNFLYRQIKDDTGQAVTPLPMVTTAANGLGAQIQVFQDGITYSYAVADAQGIKATITLPVRSDLPFWLAIPSWSSAIPDSRSYFMRIPNAPTGGFMDPTLGTTLDDNATVSSFGFKNPAAPAAPWNPVLNIVTAQGFAAETAQAAMRKLQGTTALIGGNLTDRWLFRPSVPFVTPLWEEPNNAVGTFAGISAFQTFAEWPLMLKTIPTAETPGTAGTSANLGINLDYKAYTPDSKNSDTYKASEFQAFRAPGASTDPYDLDAANWGLDSMLLAPAPVNSAVPAYFQSAVYDPQGSTAFSGGLTGLSIPYDPNDVNRQVAAPLTRGLNSIRSVFSYSEYLWSRVWQWPVTLNAATLSWVDSMNGNLGNFAGLRYTSATTWPRHTGITPRNSAFDLNATGQGSFDASFPAAENGGTPSPNGVGRFFWTAFTPFYNSVSGGTIARTWLADGASLQPPTNLTAAVAGNATARLGFLPPQDTMVDKRHREADGSLTYPNPLPTDTPVLGGYRVTWFNATTDGLGAPVAPDFWVVELEANGATQHFMLPGSFPAQTNVSDPSSGYPVFPGTTNPNPDTLPILTDARVPMTSGLIYTDPVAKTTLMTTVAPGYCWFDVPFELRPAAGTSATLRVFALKAILANNVAGKLAPRALNRTEWIEAIKTATGNVKIKASDDSDLSYAYKIPFNYAWDIVITNGPATPVAP